MKIVLDARWIFPELSGIGTYARQILGQLCQLDTDNEYVALFNDPRLAARTDEETGFAARRNFAAEIVPYRVFSPRSQIQLPRLLERLQCDVYHAPNYMVPLLPRLARHRPAYVTTIHDVIPLVIPDHAPKSKKTRLLPLFVRVIRRASRVSDAIITVSHRSRDDIIRSLHLPSEAAERIHVVHNGVSSSFSPPASSDASADPMRPRVLLYVGRADPYKNLSTLVAALQLLRDECPFPVCLRIIGPPDERYPAPELLARELGVYDAITWTGYLPERDLVREYQRADVLVHPARYEGFGLQVLEAMSCGLPVVSSNGGSLPEVAADAALLVAPDDVDGYVRSVRSVLTDHRAASRLVTRGYKRSAAFSWENAARETLAVYEHAYRHRHGGR